MMGGVTAARMTWVCTELLALWVVLPVLLWTDALPAVYRISVLVAAAVYALWVVRFERVRWDELGFRGLVGFLPSFLQGSLWIAVAVPVLFVAAALLPGEVGSLGRARPESLLALLLFYAGVSVTSQEFLYSSFFFWRYRPLFSPGFLVGLNAVVFAVAHLVYASWVSIVLALAGRVIMARIYRRHGSFWGVWLVHLLFGVAVFLVGLGRYFYRSAG
jgi:uncharacterized protein